MMNNQSPFVSASKDQHLLQDLGISASIDSSGKQKLSIRIYTGAGRVEDAFFDRSSGCWRLEHASDVIVLPKQLDANPIVAESDNQVEVKSWTDFLPQNENRDWFLNGIDWSLTNLGSVEAWPAALQAIVGLVMADTNPAVVNWGPSLCSCFNLKAYQDASKRFNKRLDLQGVPFKEIWKEVWFDVDAL